jgi:hypothetical protein
MMGKLQRPMLFPTRVGGPAYDLEMLRLVVPIEQPEITEVKQIESNENALDRQCAV